MWRLAEHVEVDSGAAGEQQGLADSYGLAEPQQINPKLRDPGDANAGGDLGKRFARQVGVLATCRCLARHLAVRR